MTPPPGLAADPRTIRVRKRPLPVVVRHATDDGSCTTLEGQVGYRAGDAILTGVRGEQWPVDAAVFRRTYRPLPPTRAGEDGRYEKLPLDALALRLDTPLEVRVGPQDDLLLAAPGDWLLNYGDAGYGVLKDEIFQATYDRIDEHEVD